MPFGIRLRVIRPAVVLVLSAAAAAASFGGEADCPQFRGAGAAGVAAAVKTPTDWDVPAGRNVKWKTPVPGLGYSSPVVWGDKLFVTTAVMEGDEGQKVRVGLYGDIQPVG